MEKIYNLFSRKRKTSEKSLRVLEAINNNWPTNPQEVASALKERGDKKHLSARILYHFRKLDQSEHIVMKKIGNTFVAWPRDIEKLRVIHDLVRE